MAVYVRNLALLIAIVGGSGPLCGQEPAVWNRESGKVGSGDVSTADMLVGDAERGPLYQYYRQVGLRDHADNARHPDPWGPERMPLPTYINSTHHYGDDNIAYNTRPDPETLGIRLDCSYGLLREVTGGEYLSEHQNLSAGTVTILPYQSPCFLLGFRALGGYADNHAVAPDSEALSLELFAGTRYKSTYFKYGAFWDTESHFGKVGLAFSAMTSLPVVGVWTVDTAWGFGSGNDKLFTPSVMLASRRAEVSDLDCQIRVGRFMSRCVQLGVTGNYSTYEFTDEESGAGAFVNFYLGRLRIGLDVTGGDEGLRGYTMMGFSFGKKPCEHPQDCRYGDIDTVSWISRGTDRDYLIRIRESYTGPFIP